MHEMKRNSEKDEGLIALTKSDSGVYGADLAEIHMMLGKRLANEFKHLNPDDTTIMAVLRGGIFLATGMYLELKCRFDLFNPKTDEFVRPKTKYVILVDSVINTGKTIKKLLTPDMFVACNVINERAVPLFGEQLYAVRISTNSYVGSDVAKQQGGVGPDTTMRLFNHEMRSTCV